MSKRDLPAAVYAAAGASDLALRRLRRLNQGAGRTVRAAAGAATDLRGRATDLRERMTDLRERASDLRGRASDLRGRASDLRGRASDLRGRATGLLERAAVTRPYRIDRARVDAELARLRESARRGGMMLVTGAAVAQERAVDGYRRLVAHGQRVMSGTGTVADESVATPLPAGGDAVDTAAAGEAPGTPTADEAVAGEAAADEQPAG